MRLPEVYVKGNNVSRSPGGRMGMGANDGNDRLNTYAFRTRLSILSRSSSSRVGVGIEGDGEDIREGIMVGGVGVIEGGVGEGEVGGVGEVGIGVREGGVVSRVMCLMGRLICYYGGSRRGKAGIIGCRSGCSQCSSGTVESGGQAEVLTAKRRYPVMC